MQPNTLLPRLNASRLQRAILNTLVCCLVAGGASMFAQIKVISADNLTPFQPRDVGTTSDAKTVRIKLNYARALTSIAVAPGFTEFTAGAVSDCVVDGHTINPALSACSLDVTFSPKYPGVRTAPLVVTDSAGIKSSVGLEGTGLAPQAALIPGIITTVAGNGTLGYSGDGGPAGEAELNLPAGAAADAAGNLYISDSKNNVIRRVDDTGVITTVAGDGKAGFIGGDGGPATEARLHGPAGIALDAAGNLYVADAVNQRIREVDINGVITTVAGGGTSLGDGGPAKKAQLSSPSGVAVDAAGNLYIADTGNDRIRKVDTNGIITTVAGGGTSGLGDGGPATSAELNVPTGVALDAAGNFYIADSLNQRVRMVNISGIITTVAGIGGVAKSGGGGFTGDGGPATSATLNSPYALVLDAAGNLYISDSANSVIRKVDTSGIISTVAGSRSLAFSGDAGAATTAALNLPQGIALDGAGNLYIADEENNRIRKVDVGQSGVVFESQAVGAASPSQKVVVTNTGNQHIDLSGLEMTGDFAQLTGLASDCTDTMMLGAAYSCALRITFNPSTTGALTGSVTVTGNSLNQSGTTQAIALSSVVQTQVSLAQVANTHGFYNDGHTYSTGGLDNYGYSYSANLLGTSLTVGTTIFNFGAPNQPNAVKGYGKVVIPLPAGSFSMLTFLGTGVNGLQSSQVFTVTYSDGSTTQFTQSLTDWYYSTTQPGETVAAIYPYRNYSDGQRDETFFDFHLHQYSFPLNTNKVVKSLTMPNNPSAALLAATLLP